MPTAINEYGIHSGGPHVLLLRWPSCSASRTSDQDFQAKKAQKTRLTASTNSIRQWLARGESKPAMASTPTWPQ